jgi:hypothetical protein
MLDVKGVREVRAMAQVFQDADRETQKAIRKATTQVSPLLKQAAQRRAFDDVSRKIANSGKVTPSRKGLQAVFGASGKHGGARLSELTRPWEFGGNQQRFGTYRRSGHKVTRRTQKQIPRKAPDGRFIYQALADAAPRIVGAWVRAVVKVIEDA